MPSYYCCSILRPNLTQLNPPEHLLHTNGATDPSFPQFLAMIGLYRLPLPLNVVTASDFTPSKRNFVVAGFHLKTFPTFRPPFYPELQYDQH